jgi:hypothetical protein
MSFILDTPQLISYPDPATPKPRPWSQAHGQQHISSDTTTVAERLAISIKSVYRHQRRFGGFHPAGIGTIRFSAETIEEIIRGGVERSQDREVEIQFPEKQEAIGRRRVLNQTRSYSCQGSAKKGNFESRCKRYGI